ncbi:sugar phosphate isomerase/epimerase [Candidatus Pacearchaeota archaeon]|nr:sugar phosphate isomerase/epimerase [Candidatus Pacearchaeota archaeon]
MAYESFYQGTQSSLDPQYGNFVGYRVPAGQLGATTSIQTANQVREVTNLLNQGIKNVEVSVIQPEIFEMIPDQHLKEINRLSKLTGSETSLHAPMIEPSGFTQQGWSEIERESSERQLAEVIERSHQLNPQGNIPVTMHSSAVPGTEYMPWKDPETGKMTEIPKKMIAVNKETGELMPLIREERFYPKEIGEGKFGGKVYTPEEELNIANHSYWDNKLSQLVFYKNGGDELLDKYHLLVEGEKKELMTGEQKQAWNLRSNAMIYFENTQMSLNSLFNQAYKLANDGGKMELQKAAEEFTKQYEKATKNKEGKKILTNPAHYSQALQGLINNMQAITNDRDISPKIYEPIEKFTKDKASDTFSGVALNAYKKFGKSAPIVSIENPPYGTAISTAQDLKDLVEITRQRFVEKAKQQGMSESEAKNAAEKLIGVTWDTSHISMMRKQGFGPERLIEEAKTIAPFVKHVHLNDNFGSTHTDLPPGMGSVPMKEVLKELDEAGFKGKKVFEGGNFFQHFQTSPHPYVLEGVGSPLYSMMNAPYWNQASGFQQGYFSGFGTYLPEQHFSIYGSGFSGLPAELGGQIAGKQSRMSGTPMD